MSDIEQPGASGEGGVQGEEGSKPESSQDQFVPKKAYESVSADMHKYKQSNRELKARLNEIEANLKAQEEERLKETDQYKTLYEKEKAERERVANEVASERQRLSDFQKRSALKQALGGSVKDEYLAHADLASIEVLENGSLSPESVESVANKFRSDHPMLIPPSNEQQITNQAAAGKPPQKQEKTLAEMTYAEKAALLQSKKAQ